MRIDQSYLLPFRQFIAFSQIGEIIMKVIGYSRDIYPNSVLSSAQYLMNKGVAQSEVNPAPGKPDVGVLCLQIEKQS